MLETPHVAVGAAIATKIPNPFISIPLAFASHILLDRIPHWNPHFYTETKKYGRPKTTSTALAGADVLIALALGIAIAALALPNYAHAATILAASLASVLPDLIKSPFFFLKKQKGLIQRWVVFERSLQVETTFAVGMFTQAAIIVASIVWIYS